MSRLEPPRIKPWKETLAELVYEFPDEFTKEPPTLKQQLKEIDQIIAIEEDHLDNPDPVKPVFEEEIPEDESE